MRTYAAAAPKPILARNLNMSALFALRTERDLDPERRGLDAERWGLDAERRGMEEERRGAAEFLSIALMT